MKLRWIASTLVVLAFASVAARAAAAQKAPDFTWESNGKTVHLSDLSGHVVVLNFFATWCGPCQGEMPAFTAASRDLASSGVVIVGVDSGSDSVESVVSFAQRYGIGYQLVVDTSDNIGNAYSIDAFPTTIVVAPNGDMVSRMEYPMSELQLERAVSRLIASP